MLALASFLTSAAAVVEVAVSPRMAGIGTGGGTLVAPAYAELEPLPLKSYSEEFSSGLAPVNTVRGKRCSSSLGQIGTGNSFGLPSIFCADPLPRTEAYIHQRVSISFAPAVYHHHYGLFFLMRTKERSPTRCTCSVPPPRLVFSEVFGIDTTALQQH